MREVPQDKKAIINSSIEEEAFRKDSDSGGDCSETRCMHMVDSGQGNRRKPPSGSERG